MMKKGELQDGQVSHTKLSTHSMGEDSHMTRVIGSGHDRHNLIRVTYQT